MLATSLDTLAMDASSSCLSREVSSSFRASDRSVACE